MKTEQLNVLQLVRKFDNGDFDNPSFETQCDAGWYDWFCKQTSLAGKTRTLYRKVKQLLKTKRIQELNLEKTYVWFKNNCPMNGSLYDDIRFADIETGQVLFTIVPKCGHRISEGERAQIHGNRLNPDDEFIMDVYKGDWKGVLEFLNK